MRITDCSSDLFSKCAVCDTSSASWFLHTALICPFVMGKLKETTRLCTLSRATKKCRRSSRLRLHLLLTTLADLEVLSLHGWKQENSLGFMMTVSKRCESGLYCFSELFCFAWKTSQWVTMKARDMHCSFKAKQKSVFMQFSIYKHANKSDVLKIWQ